MTQLSNPTPKAIRQARPLDIRSWAAFIDIAQRVRQGLHAGRNDRVQAHPRRSISDHA
jgi:hypothetical protein